MAKKTFKNTGKTKEDMELNFRIFNSVASMSTQTRESLLASLLNPRKDIDWECGYPSLITTADYRKMYERVGLAKRVVTILPEETWTQTPEVYETEKPEKTEFEKTWDQLERDLHLTHYLERVDILSGIGQFGILVLGIGDGRTLNQPVRGVDARTGEPSGKRASKVKLLYLRAFDESAVTIYEKEKDTSSPRYGQPAMYTVDFESVDSTGSLIKTSKKIHWTRVLHAADNRDSSEIYGVPRMQPVYNTLLDIRKLLAGSAEMFWKGGYQGMSFEVNPELGSVELDKASLKAEFEKYSSGLQRYLAIQGVHANQLSPNIADPKGHLEVQMQAIALTLGIPFRILLGSEEGKLASTQDKRTWSERIMKRRACYATPWLLRSLVDRLILVGILPEVEQYYTDWPDRSAASDKDIADVAARRVEAMKNYVAGGCDQLMHPMDFLTREMKYTMEEADAIVKKAAENVDEMEKKEREHADEAMEREIEKATAIAKTKPTPTDSSKASGGAKKTKSQG